MPDFWNIADLLDQRQKLGKRYFEFLRIPEMTAGVYALPSKGDDPQSPHKEDELYYVMSGRGRMKAGNADQAVAAGSVIFVEANLEHRFYDVQEELTVLVFFAPAESD
jgi:mannose-6-phosphate isomerase-like protein (cupin superfamily)